MSDRPTEVERLGIGVILGYVDGDVARAEELIAQAETADVDLLRFFIGFVVLASDQGVFPVGEWRKLALKKAAA